MEPVAARRPGEPVQWELSDGVIVMPDGTRFRGRGLRLAPDPEAGQTPEFGLYLLGSRPPATPWESRWVEWPDFRLPRDRADAGEAFRDAHRRAAHERVEIACAGGRGRTGTALACIAVLAGVPSAEAVAYIRRHYRHGAVETPFQKRFVRRFPG